MTRNRDPWCIRHRDGWCVSKKQPPAADAVSDPTLCGFTVTLRWDSERRQPDCAECMKAIGALAS